MRRLITLLTSLLLIAVAAPAAAQAASRGQCLLRKSGPQCYVWTGKVTFVGDGDTVRVDIDGDGSKTQFRVRITGMNAMEQTTYPSRASARRGECHAVEATARLEQLLKAGKYRVRLLAQDPASRSVGRLRRSLAVRVKGRWIDVGRTLINEGHALWLPNRSEHAWNRDYSILQGRAQRAQLNLWDPDYCGAGPAEGAQIRLLINWDADGDDGLDPNGEWVRITNLDPVNPLPLGGWWLRDTALRRYVFPSWAEVPPASHITLYDGRGSVNDTDFYWGLRGRGVRERHDRRDADGRRRLPVRPPGRPARVADLPVPRGVLGPQRRQPRDRREAEGPGVGPDHQHRPGADRSRALPPGLQALRLRVRAELRRPAGRDDAGAPVRVRRGGSAR